MPGTESSRYGDAFRDATILVTGGAGFIGSHLVHRLLELGASVRVLDDLSSGSRDNVPAVGVGVEIASILDAAALARAIAGCRFVFHEAAMVSVPLSVEEPARCLEINVAGTERVLTAARDAGVQRVVLASSAAVYGDDPSLPSRETDPTECCSPYAASKLADEAIAEAFSRCYGLSTASLRYFNIFGPRQDPNSPYAAVVSAFLDRLRRGVAPTIHGDGTQTRDFTYIDNVVHANLLAASVPADPRGAAINIGTGRRTSLLDLLDATQRALGTSFAPAFGTPRAGDVMHSYADLSRARAALGYEPVTDFDTGIRRTIDEG